MTDESMPSVAGLFTEKDGARIFGSRCAGCGTPYFPKVASCHNPRCDDSRIEDCSFGGNGQIWSYSVADFPPPSPYKFDKPFKPYVIAVVDMDDGLRLVGQLADGIEQATVGAKVQLVIEPLYHEDGKAYTTWKFKILSRQQGE